MMRSTKGQRNVLIVTAFCAVLAALFLCGGSLLTPTIAVQRSADVARRASVEAVETAMAEVSPEVEGQITLQFEGGLVVMTAEEFQAFVEAQNDHNQAMAEKIVQTAKSADVAQGAASVAQSGSQGFFWIILVGSLFVVFLLLREK